MLYKLQIQHIKHPSLNHPDNSTPLKKRRLTVDEESSDLASCHNSTSSCNILDHFTTPPTSESSSTEHSVATSSTDNTSLTTTSCASLHIKATQSMANQSLELQTQPILDKFMDSLHADPSSHLSPIPSTCMAAQTSTTNKCIGSTSPPHTTSLIVTSTPSIETIQKLLIQKSTSHDWLSTLKDIEAIHKNFISTPATLSSIPSIPQTLSSSSFSSSSSSTTPILSSSLSPSHSSKQITTTNTTPLTTTKIMNRKALTLSSNSTQCSALRSPTLALDTSKQQPAPNSSPFLSPASLTNEACSEKTNTKKKVCIGVHPCIIWL